MVKGRIERSIIKAGMWVLCGVLVIALAALLYATWEVYTKERAAGAAEADVRMAQSELMARRDALAADVARLTTARGIEAELRERFPLVKKGEELIILVDRKPQLAPAAPEGAAGIWESVKNWLGW